jgi:hypothetical protein
MSSRGCRKVLGALTSTSSLPFSARNLQHCALNRRCVTVS